MKGVSGISPPLCKSIYLSEVIHSLMKKKHKVTKFGSSDVGFNGGRQNLVPLIVISETLVSLQTTWKSLKI